MDDDKLQRKMYNISDSDEKIKYFEDMRRKCSLRREWGNYTINILNGNSNVKSKIKGIGFKLFKKKEL